jgi:hypothetical protein
MSLADEVRKNLLQYLPEKSLLDFWIFQSGYSLRYGMECHLRDDGFGGHLREFEFWLRDKYDIKRDSWGPDRIIDSFSSSNVEAFENFFALRDEFLQAMEADSKNGPREVHYEHHDLIYILKSARERPAMYFGNTHFRNFYLMMLGDERAFTDLGLVQGDDRKIWVEFKSWVEKNENKARLGRPWHKIISYWGGSGERALELFYKWLDEFAATIGQPELFQVPQTFWQRYRKS